jgi:hypothetical protein
MLISFFLETNPDSSNPKPDCIVMITMADVNNQTALSGVK